MSNLDLLVLSKAVRDQDFGGLLKYGFDAKQLVTGEGNTLCTFLTDYFENPITRGQTPSMSMVNAIFPEIELPDPGITSAHDLVAALRQNSVVREARALGAKISRDLVDNYNPNIIAYLSELHGQIGDLLLRGHDSADTSVEVGIDTAKEDYDKGKAGEIPYLPWPWPELRQNRWTYGMESTDFTVVYGRPKNKKSFLLLFFVVQLFLSGYPVLLYSKEMPASQIWRRVLAFLANLPYTDLTMYTLEDPAYQHMMNIIAMVKDMVAAGLGKLICISGRDAPSKMDSVAWLNTKIHHYNPRVMVVDGVYLMSNPQKTRADHERVLGISRALRNLALHELVPVIGTIQANRKVSNKAALEEDDGDGDDVAFSDSLVMDCTALMRIVASKKDDTATILWKTGRESRVPNFRINAVPCTNFNFIEAILPETAARIVEDDDQAAMDPPLPEYTAPARGSRKGKKDRGRDPEDDLLAKDIAGLVG